MYGLLTDDWTSFALGVLAWFVGFIVLDGLRHAHEVFYLGKTDAKPYSTEDLGRVVVTGLALFVLFPALYHLAPWVVFALAAAIPAIGWRRIVAKLTSPEMLAAALQGAGKLTAAGASPGALDLAGGRGGLAAMGRGARPMQPLRRKSKRAGATAAGITAVQ